MSDTRAWRPQGSPLPYTKNVPEASYSSGDPCGRHVYACYGIEQHLFHWFSLVPVPAHLHLNFDGDEQLFDALHFASHQFAGRVQFAVGHLEDQFVMHLEDHARAQALLCDGVLDANHGDFDQIGVAALDGHVDGFTFERLPFVEGQSGHIGEEAFAPVHGVDVALPASLVERAFDVLFDVREGLMIASNELARLAVAHACDIRQAEGRLAVQHGVDNGFCQAALIFRDLGQRSVEERSRRDGMNILVGIEGFDQARLVRDVRQDTQLNLRVVGCQQPVAGVGDEGAAQLSANFCAYRDILEVRVARTRAARSTPWSG